MAQNIVIYLVLHQPRRLRLPAFPIPPGARPADMARALFDERMNHATLKKLLGPLIDQPWPCCANW